MQLEAWRRSRREVEGEVEGALRNGANVVVVGTRRFGLFIKQRRILIELHVKHNLSVFDDHSLFMYNLRANGDSLKGL